MWVTEPVTMMTDYGLAVLCAFYAWRLWKAADSTAQISVGNWAAGMACLAVASLLGGTFHGLSMLLEPTLLRQLWKGTVYAVGLASFFWFAGVLRASVNALLYRWLVIVPLLQLAVFGWWMGTHDNFLFVIYDYGSMNVVLLALQLYGWYTLRIQSAPWLVGGVAVSVLAAAVQAGGFSFHRHFNHNDLYHVIQMGGMYLFYRGGCLLRDR